MRFPFLDVFQKIWPAHFFQMPPSVYFYKQIVYKCPHPCRTNPDYLIQGVTCPHISTYPFYEMLNSPYYTTSNALRSCEHKVNKSKHRKQKVNIANEGCKDLLICSTYGLRLVNLTFRASKSRFTSCSFLVHIQ